MSAHGIDLEAFRRNGFAGPFRAMDADEARQYHGKFEAYETEIGRRVTEGDPKCRLKTHTLLPWVGDLVRHPRILDTMEAVLGPDILCWTCTWFVKDARTEALTVWHQDAAYFGLRPHLHVTAWLALSEASEEAGCMRFVPGTNRNGLMRHVANAVPNSINSGGQRTERDFPLGDGVPVPLSPGEFSLHHTLAVHASGANRTDERRIGLGISYVPATVRHIGSIPVSASLVRGEDRHGFFEHEERLAAGPAWERWERHFDSYQRSYEEQMEWHAAGRWEAA